MSKDTDKLARAAARALNLRTAAIIAATIAGAIIGLTGGAHR